MEPIEIWKLENGTAQLILKGTPNPDTFWLEVYRNGGFVEKSAVVHDWETEVEKLLVEYDWKSYETSFVDSMFTPLVSQFNRRNGRYRRPSSRERILALYERFMNGNDIALRRVADEFGVGTAEITRDISIIRKFLNQDERQIQYSRSDNCYRLVHH